MKTVISKAHLILLSVSALTLVGCGTASTLISKPNESRYKSSYVRVEQTQPPSPVQKEYMESFDQALSRELYFEENSFYKGDGLILSYKFLSLNSGDRVKRLATFGTSDKAEGNLVIETTYKSHQGKEVGKIETHAHVSGGPLGGSINEALEKAAKEIASYTKIHFKQ